MSRLINIGTLSLWLLFSGALALSAAHSPATAQTQVPAVTQILNLNAIKPLSRYPSPTAAEFAAQSAEFSDLTQPDKALDYSIRLPNGWRRGDSEKTGEKIGIGGSDDGQRNVLNRLAIFNGSDGFGQLSRLEISSLRLSYNISLDNWFSNYVISSGYTLQGVDRVNPNRVEALYVVLEGDQSYVVRTVAEMNGKFIEVVSYYMPEEDFNAHRGLQEKVVGSFHFINSVAELPEPPLTFVFLDLLRFDYPNSWHIDDQDIDSPGNMSAILIGEATKAGGAPQISVHVIAAQGTVSLADKLQDQKNELAKVGISVGTLLDAPQDFTAHSQVYFKRVEVYDAHGSSNQYVQQEYWLAVYAESRYYYIVDMLTPSRSANFLVWARNTQAFRTVVESMRP